MTPDDVAVSAGCVTVAKCVMREVFAFMLPAMTTTCVSAMSPCSHEDRSRVTNLDPSIMGLIK